MNQEHKNKAIAILSKSISVKVSFNVPVKDSYDNIYEILIHESNASVINELIAEGFLLSMNPKGLSVNKY